MEQELGINNIGSIKLNNKVYITDPCYDISTWYMEYLEDVQPGTYKCFVNVVDKMGWGRRRSELVVVNEEFLNSRDNDLSRIRYRRDNDCTIGVDSVQCGIFDADYYEEHQPDDDYNKPYSWYRTVCDISWGGNTIDNQGVVTDSGYGDGAYSLYLAKKSDKVVAMKIRFI